MRELIYTAQTKIRGITPMLHHKCGIIEKNMASKSTDYSEEWIKTTYTDDNNKLIIPQLLIEACLRDGSKGLKIGKYFMTKLVPTGTTVIEFEIPLIFESNQITIEDIKKNNWLFECSAVVTGKRINRIRTCIPVGWGLEFKIEVYEKLIKSDNLRNLIEIAGYSAGLGDWRPGAKKPGKFGQFELIKFEII